MTEPHYADGQVTLYHGDALDVLREMADESVDAVVTDPPYGLADHAPAMIAQAVMAWVSGDREHVPDGKGFMGRDWDRFVPPPAVWDECLRVLKPGGHLLAFAGARTLDLMAMSIRFAGFEIRDGIDWIYSQGFPKSLNVSAAIDRQRAARGSAPVDAVRAWLNARRVDAGMTLTQVNDALGVASNGGGLASLWMTNQTSKALPSWEQWCSLKQLLGFGDDMDAEVLRLNDIASGADRPVVGQRTTGLGVGRGDVPVITAGSLDITGPATDAAAQWAGWGTALKPAREPIVVARKPLAGTVAANVVAHGTGAINIEACRAGAEPRTNPGGGASSLQRVSRVEQGYRNTVTTSRNEQTDVTGRWPSNVVLSHAATPDGVDLCAGGCVDGCPVAELDRQSGVLTSGANPTRRGRDTFRDAYGEFRGQADCTPARGADSGGASRFFPVFRYEAKATAAERPRVDGVAHPTVKPLDLMRWLARLVTPPGGTVLDLFAGSGTTGEACVAEGFPCVLVEREATYLPLITSRLTKPIPMALFGEVTP